MKHWRSLLAPFWAPGCFTRFKDSLDGETQLTLGWRKLSFEYCVTVSKTRSRGVFITNVGSQYCYFYHFTDEGAKAQRGHTEADLGSHSSKAARQSLEFRICDAYVKTFHFNLAWNSASLLGVWSLPRECPWESSWIWWASLSVSLTESWAFPGPMVDFVPGAWHHPVVEVQSCDSLGML